MSRTSKYCTSISEGKNVRQSPFGEWTDIIVQNVFYDPGGVVNLLQFQSTRTTSKVYLKMKLITFLFLALLGVAAAFFRPEVPFQLDNIVHVVSVDLRGGGYADTKDRGLDNPGTLISTHVDIRNESVRFPGQLLTDCHAESPQRLLRSVTRDCSNRNSPSCPSHSWQISWKIRPSTLLASAVSAWDDLGRQTVPSV